MDVIEWSINNWDNILTIIAYIIASASVIVKLTPTQKDDEILGKIVNFLKMLSLHKDVTVGKKK